MASDLPWFRVPKRVVLLRSLAALAPVIAAGVLLWTVLPGTWRDEGTLGLCITAAMAVTAVVKDALY